jgi:hypothetical protein
MMSAHLATRRVILVSADFGREITTAPLWLNRFEGMEIRCVRLVPYEIQGTVFLDIQQVIPLPEVADYQVRLRKKDVASAARMAIHGTSRGPRSDRAPTLLFTPTDQNGERQARRVMNARTAPTAPPLHPRTETPSRPLTRGDWQ